MRGAQEKKESAWERLTSSRAREFMTRDEKTGKMRDTGVRFEDIAGMDFLVGGPGWGGWVGGWVAFVALVGWVVVGGVGGHEARARSDVWLLCEGQCFALTCSSARVPVRACVHAVCGGRQRV